MVIHLLDRQILQGKVTFPKKILNKNKFPEKNINNLFKEFNKVLYRYLLKIKEIFPNNNDNKWIKHLASNKFFSFLIDEKYQVVIKLIS